MSDIADLETVHHDSDDEKLNIWKEISALPPEERRHYSVLRRTPSELIAGEDRIRLAEKIDVRKLDLAGRKFVLRKALGTNSQDNSNLLA